MSRFFQALEDADDDPPVRWIGTAIVYEGPRHCPWCGELDVGLGHRLSGDVPSRFSCQV